MSRWSDRTLRRLAWAGWWVVAGLAILETVVTSIGDPELPVSWGTGLVGAYGFTLVVLAFPLVGVGILVRQPRNRIGWLLEGVGLAWTVPSLLNTYAHYGLVIEPGSVPGADVAAALYEGAWSWGILMMGVFLILPFPDGHLLGPRWRVVAWLAVAAAALVPAAVALAPGTLEEAPVSGIANPLAAGPPEPVVLAISVVALPLVPICLVASAVSLALRFRGSSGVQREQIKWLVTAGGLVTVLFAVTLTSTLAVEFAGGGPPEVPPLPVRIMQEASNLSFVLLPLAIGAAILRYRLYDIDLVINRALVYGSLTAALAGVYLGSVLLLQLVLRPVQVDSDLAVAISTLAVAAVFRPARSRIQSSVDRRFYRHKYDAARTLDRFATHLRDELDLETLQHDLRQVVLDTVHPTQVSVWLREADR